MRKRNQKSSRTENLKPAIDNANAESVGIACCFVQQVDVTRC